ncbi:MAG: hypothetical protein OEW45_00975 [Deltaproteobacteria bacterium]|nr:hypothetical protein [Deltaproteobacteria bacterium]
MSCGQCCTGTEGYLIDSCSETEVCHSDDLADASLLVCEQVCYPLDVPRTDPGSGQDAQPAVLSCPDPDDMQNWPRYTVAQRRDSDHSIYLAIFRPDQGNAQQRLRELTLSDIRDSWERFRGSREINPDDSATWGPMTSLNLPLGHLRRLDDGRRELEFDSSRTDTRWTFNVYNLSPIWRSFMIRTLMIFPVEFMRAMPIRSVYLDFRVGQAPGLTGVGTGGANWPRCHEDSQVPQEHRNGICVAFAALNRPWCHHNQDIRALNPSCEQIENSFSDTSLVASTIYHEYGHIFQWCERQPSDFGDSGQEQYEQEVAYWEELTRNGRNAVHNDSHTGSDRGLWDRFRMAINYSGSSQGPGEGFAEALRMRLMGINLGTGGLRGAKQHASQVLDIAGIPTRDSVVTAREAITQYLSGNPL